ncbi:serine/threonine protein kinase [Roseimaritima sediminicola]|uniref:serine/threonine protein kinase n=1 Tax=Roseimaritima sediminicola TaxID=2662066 RepID=UPI00129836C0|nr:serine/threonine-protein kinase [Roseimaritima sediminicola]
MTKIRDFLGPYRLTRLIRAGRSCEVWEAIEAETDEHYALKILRPKNRHDKGELASLKHEYAVASTLATSNRVIKIYDFRIENDTPLLVMELFSELNMKQALRRGPESLAFMLDKIVEQAAEGLYFTHTKGWIHRDIKPDNFLVSREGETKLIDFQIAEKKRTGLSKFFGKSAIEGTRSYMSPEQIRGKNVDERSDIYSFGCVLFELVTAKPPYTGSTPNELLNKHLKANIPTPIVHNDNVSADFANLIRKMMAKSPENRPDSMWEFLKEVRAMNIFKRTPRAPEISVFDDLPSFKNPDDLFRS